MLKGRAEAAVQEEPQKARVAGSMSGAGEQGTHAGPGTLGEFGTRK